MWLLTAPSKATERGSSFIKIRVKTSAELPNKGITKCHIKECSDPEEEFPPLENYPGKEKNQQ